MFALTAVRGLPIYNGFSVKFSPLLHKEETRPKTFGALFAKIPQEAKLGQEAQQKTLIANIDILGMGCTNQVAKIVYPAFAQNGSYNASLMNEYYIHIPILQQPVGEYKILVAAAPPDVRINKYNDRPLVVYIVFPNDTSADNVIPRIYFVHEAKGYIDIHNKKVDPVIIIDHKRKVTNLKSNEISKFVKFKNNLINHYRSVSYKRK